MLKPWWKCDKLNFLKHLIANLQYYQILSRAINALKCRQKRPTMTMISNLSSSYKSTHLIISSLLLYVFLSSSLRPESWLPLRQLRWEKGLWIGNCSDYRLWRLRYDLIFFFLYFPGGLEVKASARNAGDPGSIPGSGRSPGEENGNPLQYSCLENPMDGGVWLATGHRVTKSQTRLSDFTSIRCGGLTWFR